MIINYQNNNTFIGDGGVAWQAGLPTMVMLHGAGLDKTVWVLLGRYFARHGFNLLIPDLPQHGNSEGHALPSISAYADWVNGLVDQVMDNSPLSADNLTYCGHSMGSLIVMEAAAKRLNTDTPVANLILLGGAIPMPVGAPLLQAAEANDHAAIDMIDMYGFGFGSRIGNNPVAGISVYNSMEALLERAEPGVLHNDLSACNAYLEGETAAEALKDKVASTVIVGALDRMTPAKLGASLCKQLNGQLHTLEDCGHMMMSEKPEETLQAMKQALASLVT